MKEKISLNKLLGIKPSPKKEAEQKHDKKLKEMKEEKKKESNDPPSEKYKMVVHGAKIQCKYTPAPGTLMVTSNQIQMHGQLWATEGDCGKLNLQFQGICTHSKWGYNKPPCLGVIIPTKWEDVGNMYVQEQKNLIKKSTIKCGISNEAIKIIFDGQIETPVTLSNAEMDVCG
jgi:hypothetical protein